MSSLLKEAIVDAAALREAALKNAESSIIDKYSDEVRTALTKLLEQDELGADLDLGGDMGGDLGGDMGADLGGDFAPPAEAEGGESDESLDEDTEDVPYAATDSASKMNGDNLTNLPPEGKDVEVTLDLGALRESVASLQAEIDEELSFDESDLKDMLSEDDDDETTEYGDTDASAGAASAAEESADDADASGKKGSTIAETETDDVEISDELIDSIAEKLTVDMGYELSGWAGRPDFQKKQGVERDFARRRGTDANAELETLKKAKEELTFENKQLKKRLSQYEQATTELKEAVQDTNLSNARLLYTNRVLRNTSLNERQKEKIVEAISRADSVAEAKTIYKTLESAAGAKPTRSPQSLSEAITRPSSVIRATSKESAQPTDPFAERMRRLAGIK